MCKRCDKIVLEMDIRETDLPNLPFTLVRWKCLVPGCRCMNIILRDYGIAPIYYWPVKKSYSAKGFRGGWTDGERHWRLCYKHWQQYQQFGIGHFAGLVDSDEYRMSCFLPYKSKSKKHGLG